MNVLVMAAPGRRVRLPDGQVLSDATEAVEVDRRDLFIVRRLADGDLLAVPEAPEPPAASPPPAAKEKAR